MVDIVTTLKETSATYDEAINKYFIAKYIIARESYSPSTRNYLYRLVGLMSSADQTLKYGEWYSGRSGQSPLQVYGDTASAAVEIKNISFVDKQIALIRFSKIVTRSTERHVTHWVATMSFEFLRAAKMSADDQLLNPLGFQCVEYRLDPEVLTK
jgi:type IV secretion system protein VirB8